MVKVTTGDEESNEAQANRDLEAALERVEAIDRGRAETAWSARGALYAALHFLAILDNFMCALNEPCPVGADNAEGRVQWIVARGEAVARMEPLVDGAYWSCCDALKHTSDAPTQRVALANIQLAAREVRWRAALTAPDTEQAIRASRSPWDAPPAFNDNALRVFKRANASTAAARVRAQGGALADDVAELDGHLERLAGGALAAPPARAVRAFSGVMATTRARHAALHGPPPDTSTPGKKWAEILDIARAVQHQGNPLAALVVFVEAAGAVWIGPGAQRREGDYTIIQRLPMLALRRLACAGDYDGPRDLARDALRALGHDVEEFTNAERAARRRRKGARQSGKATAKPAHDARKRRAKTP